MVIQKVVAVSTHPNSLVLSDCGELYLYSKEPVVSSGAGAPAVQTDRGAGAGRPTGQRVTQ